MRKDSIEVYLPIAYNLGDSPSDGLHGPAVEYPGVVYAWCVDECEELFEEVICQTTLKKMIEEVIDLHTIRDTGKIDEDAVGILSKIKEHLKKLVQFIDDTIKDKGPWRP